MLFFLRQNLITISADWILYCCSTRLYTSRRIAFLCIGALQRCLSLVEAPLIFGGPFLFQFCQNNDWITAYQRIKHQTGLLQEYHLPVYLVYLDPRKPFAHMILSSHELNHGRVVHGLVGLRFAATTSPTTTTASGLSKTRRHRTHSQHLDAGRAPGHNQLRPQEQPTPR